MEYRTTAEESKLEPVSFADDQIPPGWTANTFVRPNAAVRLKTEI